MPTDLPQRRPSLADVREWFLLWRANRLMRKATRLFNRAERLYARSRCPRGR